MDVINAGLDIVCLTSLNEGTPVSLIEAQAANKPIVSTEVGGVKDVVREGTTALLAGIHDKQTLFDHLLSLVDNDALRTRMGKNGVDFVSERYGVKRLASDFRDLYYALLEGNAQLDSKGLPAFFKNSQALSARR